MCGRYAITLTPEAYRNFFGYAEQPNFPPRYNVAPTQPVPIAHVDRGERHLKLVRWGFLPAWVKDPKDFPLVINARGETLLTKPTFQAAMKRRRCIFLADGFYEWKRQGRGTIPFLVRPRDRGPMPMAGLWETYTDPSGGEIDTAAIITTTANGLLSSVHHRMPVILERAAIAAWLDPDHRSLDEAMALVRPSREDLLDLVPVGSRVNKAENDDPSLQSPVSPSESSHETGETAQTTKRQKMKTRPNDDDEQGRLF